MASVAIENVVKNYGAVRVMHGLSLDIVEGEFLVLVGPSGCGKSTLLRMIAGLEDITGGEISIADLVVNDIEPKERNIAMVFQNYALYPHMSVAQNMGFSLKLSGLPKDQIRKKVEDAASILGLEPLLDRHPGQLSGGQRQRVAMGRAIVRDPAVFLFDEPLSNLDAKLRVQMRTEIKSLHQRLKTTMVYVTHDQVEAMTMADRIVVMHDGRIEQIGTPLELYDRPDNLFVAGFIGSPAMNLIEGQVRDGRFVGDNGLQTDAPAGGSDGERVVCGIRPDQLSFVDGDVAEIEVIEPTGAETQVVLHTGGEQITCLLRERLTLNPGDKTGIRINAEQAHFFNAVSGQRIN